MKQKYLLAVILPICAIAAVVIGYTAGRFHIFQPVRHIAVQPIPQQQTDYEISYTNQGFVPQTLTIPVGMKVAFKNNSDIDLVVGANPYPTHSDYAAFVADRSYKKGETYIFEFEVEGTFGFYNGAKRTDTGIIKAIDGDSDDIDKTRPDQQAARDKIVAMLKPNQPHSIFAAFDAITADKKLSYDCHDIGHDLGHASYELYGFSTALTLTDPERLNHISAEDICAGGYMHGILEEVILHQPELKNTPAAMCASVPNESRASCFHGVGHALMFVYKRDLESSLAGCTGLNRTDDAHSCYEGVWMELFLGSTEHSGPNTLGWDTTKPLDPCIAATIDDKPACFLYANLGYLRTHHQDYAGSAKICLDTKLSPNDVKYCMIGVGMTTMNFFTKHDLKKTADIVRGYSVDQKKAYYKGVIDYGTLSGITADELSADCGYMGSDAAICRSQIQK